MYEILILVSSLVSALCGLCSLWFQYQTHKREKLTYHDGK